MNSRQYNLRTIAEKVVYKWVWKKVSSEKQACLSLMPFFFCKIIFTLHISVPFAEIFHWLFNPNKTGLQASTVRPVQHLNKYYWAQKAKQLDVRDTST